jgi:hypothetical protein
VNRTDRAIKISTGGAVLAVAGIAAYISYWHAYTVVRSYGASGVTARLEPATIDGLVYACSMVMLYAARHPQVTAPRLARWLLALGITATLAANMAVGWSHGPVGAVVAAWPAASLVGSYELLVWIIRTSAAVSPDSILTADHPELAVDRDGPLEPAVAGPQGEAGGTAAGAGPGAWSGRAMAVPAGQHSGPGEDQADQAAGPEGASPGNDVNSAAADAYRNSVLAGRPLSERELARTFGRTSRRWARNRMAEARGSEQLMAALPATASERARPGLPSAARGSASRHLLLASVSALVAGLA